MQLSKEIGISQKSAWFMLQRLREGCRGNGWPLSGIVEIDETYVGGKERKRWTPKFGQVVKVGSRPRRRSLACHGRDGVIRLS